ncbi:prepilin peptidase [Candidatus Gracilibacteria bacterium]|nr:prepilin peptidase [Candidatus Gracilibacteria bacterium]
MHFLFYSYIALLGLLFGSFASVLIYRLKSGEKGILLGRSHCRCGKKLTFTDLIPLFGWLKQRGKCNVCGNKISGIYPLLELSTGMLFVLSSIFLVDMSGVLQGNITEIFSLLFWLTMSFITILYVFYDLLFMEIHEGIMGVGVGIAVLPLIISFFEGGLHLGNIIILIVSLIGYYTILLKGLHEAWDAIIFCSLIGITWGGYYLFGTNVILDALTAMLVIFGFFFVQIIISRGRWIGGGDLRIALLVGLLLGNSLILPGLFATYLLGSIISLSIIGIQKIFQKKGLQISSQIPFGPFIALGCFVVLFWQQEIQWFMSIYF